MAYQFLVHDGFVYRRPQPPDDDWFDAANTRNVEIWNGHTWMKPITVEIAMDPIYYGHAITEDAAKKRLGQSW
jgi:hypothetical protein